MDRIREELEQSLSNDRIAVEDKELYIWGTGNTAGLYREGLNRLETEGLVVRGYCDNDPAKYARGCLCNGKDVISPEQLKKTENACVLICSPRPDVVAAVSKQVEQMGIEYYHIDEVIFKTHKDEIMACYDLLDDEKSQKIYKDIIIHRMMGTYPCVELTDENQYFAIPPFMQRNPKEVFVDCGAFVGDSIETFLWKRDGVFSRIIAFEPDPDNYAASQYRLSRLKREWNIADNMVSLYPYGIGDKSTSFRLERNMANNGLGSKMGGGGTLCDCEEDSEICRVVALDDFIEEPVSFIKADIESFEYKMLLGAKNTIIKNRPLIAICIYHNAVDMYSIPLLLKTIMPKYHMAIRHHSYVVDETVLYAWID